MVSLTEPMRLWWRGDLDGYIGRPLLSGAAPAIRAEPGRIDLGNRAQSGERLRGQAGAEAQGL